MVGGPTYCHNIPSHKLSHTYLMMNNMLLIILSRWRVMLREILCWDLISVRSWMIRSMVLVLYIYIHIWKVWWFTGMDECVRAIGRMIVNMVYVMRWWRGAISFKVITSTENRKVCTYYYILKGYGVHQMQDGERFEGQWINGLRHGKGTW